MYVSAQHWTIAPLWSWTQDVQAFRLIGALILSLSATVLAIGSVRMSDKLGIQVAERTSVLATVAAGTVGAFLYVSTIAPSPSYNLLAAAGASAGLGFALLAAVHERLRIAVLYAAAAGIVLAIGFLNKPSAGVSTAFLSAIALLALGFGWRRLMLLMFMSMGSILCVFAFYAVQPSEPPVLDSLRLGLALFQIVQSEPVSTRLVRYLVTMLSSIGDAVLAFAPAVGIAFALLIWPRVWLALLLTAALIVSIWHGAHYLGGMDSYERQITAIFSVMFILTLLALPTWTRTWHRGFFGLILLALPYAVSIGTGNALFTQVIVSLAAWSVIATLFVFSAKTPAEFVATCASAAILLLLICTQIFSSYDRRPYHLATPLTGQSEPEHIADLGVLRLDRFTHDMIKAVSEAQQTCNIAPGTDVLGLYNTPGLVLMLEGRAPVTPWINNFEQLEAILPHYIPSADARKVVILTEESQGSIPEITLQLDSSHNEFQLCGTLFEPFENETIQIWAELVAE